MPRQARTDAPDAVHHIMARGIERRSIFRHDEDRDDFIDRLNRILTETKTPRYAWALTPDHFHPGGRKALLRPKPAYWWSWARLGS
jgi:REP element-mobilizing transposase RayT